MLADRYELRGVLGQGGMGIVYDCVAHGAHGFTRRVALKRLAPDAAADPIFEKLFRDEARTASRLHHAGIVAVLDFGVVDGAPFQVLELVEGVDASILLRRLHSRSERMPVDIALYLATEVAHALAYAHAARGDDGSPLGIVHRDVKPSNIFVSWSGDVKLGDFGIALARDRISTRTTGFGRGTPAYMPPEQLLGTTVDARADVFALGCTLHALVVGTSPLARDDARHALLTSGELQLSSELPEDVGAIVARATRPSASDRYATAREMAAALGEALAGRLKTDPKSRILPWLDTLAIDRPRPQVGATTILIANGGGTSRMFQEAGPTRTLAPASDVAPDRPAPRGTTRPRAAGASNRAVFVYGLLAALALGGLGGGVVLASRRTQRPPTDAGAAGSIETSHDPPPPVASSSEPPPTPGPASSSDGGVLAPSTVHANAAHRTPTVTTSSSSSTKADPPRQAPRGPRRIEAISSGNAANRYLIRTVLEHVRTVWTAIEACYVADGDHAAEVTQLEVTFVAVDRTGHSARVTAHGGGAGLNACVSHVVSTIVLPQRDADSKPGDVTFYINTIEPSPQGSASSSAEPTLGNSLNH